MDQPTVEGFGFEWSVYDQGERDPASLGAAFDRYFAGFPWEDLPSGSVGVDVGCGTARWARLVAVRGLPVVAIDASGAALAVAARVADGCDLVQASADRLPLRAGSAAFGFSLGVLHHVPDPVAALREIRRVLAPGAPFLLYVYYALDGRPAWYRALWKASDWLRRRVAALAPRTRLRVTRWIAALVYLPLARTARLLERLGAPVDGIPLAAYRDQPLYVMRTDALDRFGTPLEHRFRRDEVEAMLRAAGFSGSRFAEDWPYWRAIARA